MIQTVIEEGPLLSVLQTLFKEFSHKKLKGYLTGGAVLVNQQVITQYNYLVRKGDKLEIRKQNKTHQHSLLPILYEDEDFLVVDKPSGLLTISTGKEKEHTAYHLMREFVKNRGQHDKIFILHRLDRDTSGVLVFVKKEALKLAFQASWDTFVKEREYYGVVRGKPEDQQHYVCYLQEDRQYKVYVTDDKTKGKKAITSFQKVRSNDTYSLLKIHLETGRKNQIRVVLSHLGYPLVGDTKYQLFKEKAKRLYLHASCIVLVHPLTKKTYTFTSKLPTSFQALVGL